MRDDHSFDQKRASQLIVAFSLALGLGFYGYAQGGYKIFKDEPTCPVGDEIPGEDVPALDYILGLCD